MGPEPHVAVLLRRADRTRRRNSTILLEYGCNKVPMSFSLIEIQLFVKIRV